LELSGWRNFICLLVYLSALGVASFVLPLFLTQRIVSIYKYN